jgi:hypothetical protein
VVVDSGTDEEVVVDVVVVDCSGVVGSDSGNVVWGTEEVVVVVVEVVVVEDVVVVEVVVVELVVVEVELVVVVSARPFHKDKLLIVR